MIEIMINEDRTIEPNSVDIGVCGDNITETLYITAPVLVNGIDVSGYSLYMLLNGVLPIELSLLSKDEVRAIYTYTLTSSVYALGAKISVQFRLQDNSSMDEIPVWNSKLMTFNVASSIYSGAVALPIDPQYLENAQAAAAQAVLSAQTAQESADRAELEFDTKVDKETGKSLINSSEIIRLTEDLSGTASGTNTGDETNESIKTKLGTDLSNKLDKTGDGSDVTATFTQAGSLSNITTGEKLSVIFGKVKKVITDYLALVDIVSIKLSTVTTNSTLTGAGTVAIPLSTRSTTVVDYTVDAGAPISMLSSQVSNNGSGKILITIANHGYANGNVLELSGAIPTGIAKINNANFPLVYNKAYVYVMNKTTNTFEISATVGGTAITYSDGGTNGWTLVKPVGNSIALSSLDFNADGGEWDITISGTLLPTTLNSEYNAFRLNGVNTTVYYSSNLAAFSINPYNYFYVGGSNAKHFYDCTISIRIKRLSETAVSVFAQNVGLATHTFADTPSVINASYGGRTVDSSFTNLTSFTFYPNVGCFASGTKIIIRRIN